MLNGSGARLPNAQVVGECAAALNVSADWLLSLSDRPENTADLLAGSIAMTPATRTMIDEQVFNWHREAAGYKIRHVPATMPDILKTDEMLAWEYAHHLGRTSQQAIDGDDEFLKVTNNSTLNTGATKPANVTGDNVSVTAVSYTHLTLPTILRV